MALNNIIVPLSSELDLQSSDIIITKTIRLGGLWYENR